VEPRDDRLRKISFLMFFEDGFLFVTLTMSERIVNEEWESKGLALDSSAGVVFQHNKFVRQPLSIGKHYGEQSRVIQIEESNGHWEQLGKRLQVFHPIEVAITKLPDGSHTSALFAHGVMTVEGFPGEHFTCPAAPGITEAFAILTDDELKLLIPKYLAEELNIP
jgi:hypothetical protein